MTHSLAAALPRCRGAQGPGARMATEPLLLLYRAALYLCLPAILLHLALRGLRNPAYWSRWPERFGFSDVPGTPHLLWLHAVSVGEVRAATPLIKSIQSRFPQGRILVTTTTPTGSQEVVRTFAEGVDHCYAPYDYPGSVRRFLARARPALVVIMETEIWPNIISQCHALDIPVVFSNVRLSERSHRRYRRVRRFCRQLLVKVDRFAVQTPDDANRIVDLGAKPDAVEVTASIKFEVALPASLREVADVVRHDWGRDRRVWVAGSTHENEEEMVLDIFARLRREFPDLLLVIVPRHPERFSPVTRLCRRRGLNVARRSETTSRVGSDVDVYIGDTMGELPVLYAAGDVAFVGGSLVRVGGHNLLEPCAVGVPVVFGPHVFNFSEIARITLQRGAGTQVAGVGELEHAVRRYLSDANLRFTVGEVGRQMVEENRGALQRNLRLLEGYLARAASHAAGLR